ncbi:MAG: acyltransferase [Candidatus Protochlamydia sp.]|nr:acyltransferase [Candidatus Protochlamydia sp.]
MTASVISNKRFQFLDGLRGVAALWVVLMHMHTLIKERSAYSFPFLLDFFLSHGEVGVSIFFVLSGFVISYSIRNARITWPFIGNFFLRRSLRLDPPYWAALIALSAIILIGSFFFNKGGEHVPDGKDLLLNFFYLQNFFSAPNILPVAWTLCLEFQFYFTLVLGLKIIQFFNQNHKKDLFNYNGLSLVLLNGLFLFSLAYAADLKAELPIEGTFIPFWYSFYMGCLLCWILTKSIPEYFFYSAMGALLLFFFRGDNDQIFTTGMVSLGIFYCIKQNKLHTFLSSTIFQYLGKISYSLYLIHWLVGIKFISFISFFFQGASIHPLLLLFLSLGISIGVAELFYRLIEQPCLLLSRKIKSYHKDENIEKITPAVKF